MQNPLRQWDPSRRRALIGILALAMLAVPATRVFEIDSAAIEHARQETAGLAPLWDLLDVIRTAQRHRGLANGWLAGGGSLADSRVAARNDLNAALGRARVSLAALDAPALQRRLARIAARTRDLTADVDAHSIAPEQSFRRHTALIADLLALVNDLAEATGIAFHTEPAGHQLQAAVLNFLPQSAERLGRVRGMGTKLLARHHATSADRAVIAFEGNEARALMRGALRTLAASGLADSPGPLSLAISAASRATTTALDRARHDIVNADTLSAPAADYFAALTVAIDRQFALIRTAFEVLRTRLERAKAAAQRRLALHVAGLLLLAGLGLWLLALAEHAQRAQEASDARSRAIIDAAPDAIFVLAPDGRVVEANPAAARLYGRAAIGVVLTDLFAAESRAAITTALRAIDGGASGTAGSAREVVGLRADGTTWEAEMTGFPVASAPQCQTIIVVRDISERHRLQRQLGQSQKMEAIGQLTGGIAHDFNNLLGVIVGNLDLIERSVAGQESTLRRVHTAQKAALRGADLTRRLLAFSRRQHLEPAPQRLADTVSNVFEMARRTLGPEMVLSTKIAPDTPDVMADAAGLENVLLNLLVNARDAMPRGGRITIEVGDVEVDERHPAVVAGDLAPGRYASVRVTDSGQGIPADQLDKVFEPFFTTKDQGKGTGLGLAMTYGFIKQTGGHIKIYSEVGVGTTIAILLPVVTSDGSAETTPVPTGIAAEHRAAPGATALVVDDEPDLREVAATYLEEMGYRVLTAPDGPTALRLLTRESGIDLLVTDIVMPGGLNGVKLGQQVRRRRPHVRIVYTSGFPSQALAERGRRRPPGPLVNKPFQRRDFASALNRVMEGETA